MGQVELDGEDITGKPPHKRHIGILFQDDLLFPHMSVGANLAFGMPAGGSKQQRLETINQTLTEVGLAGLDEAFSRLDAELRGQVRTLVFETAKERALPVLMVTHDAEDARAAGGKIIELESLSKG